MKEKRCWICRRTQKDLEEAWEKGEAGSYDFESLELFESKLYSRLFICSVCRLLISGITIHDDDPDETDSVLFGDLDKLKRKIIETLES